jgi:purine-binding chemotaxis protein CheW
MVQHFLFSADNVRCAVPLASIQSVIQMIEMTPASGAHHGLAGAVNLHGRVISVYSMRRLLGFADRKPRLSDMLLIAQAGKETSALWIDEICGVEGLDLSLVTPLKTGTDSDLIQGIGVTESGILVISDLPAFISQASGPGLQEHLLSLKTESRPATADEGGREELPAAW